MGKYILEGKVHSRRNIENTISTKTITFNPRVPFKFQRKQFHLVFYFTMTINKIQGQYLKHVKIYLPQKLIFSREHLYVVALRVTSKKKILIFNDKYQ